MLLLNLMIRKTKNTNFNIIKFNYEFDTWKCQDHFYKFNGFKSTLIFKVQTHLLPVKANFTSRNIFSGKCPMCLLEPQYSKQHLMIRKLCKSSS